MAEKLVKGLKLSNSEDTFVIDCKNDDLVETLRSQVASLIEEVNDLKSKCNALQEEVNDLKYNQSDEQGEHNSNN